MKKYFMRVEYRTWEGKTKARAGLIGDGFEALTDNTLEKMALSLIQHHRSELALLDIIAFNKV